MYYSMILQTQTLTKPNSQMPAISQTPTHHVVGKMRLDWKPEIPLGCLLTGVTVGKSLHFSEPQFPYLLKAAMEPFSPQLQKEGP